VRTRDRLVLADAVDAADVVGDDPFIKVRGVRSIMW
jgi:hypothetical protein